MCGVSLERNPKRQLHGRDRRAASREKALLGEPRDQVPHPRETEEDVHLGDLALEFRPVPLDHAPDRRDSPDPPLLLHRAGLENRLDRLLLRRLDESAGVDHDEIRTLDLAGDPGAPGGKRRHEPL